MYDYCGNSLKASLLPELALSVSQFFVESGDNVDTLEIPGIHNPLRWLSVRALTLCTSGIFCLLKWKKVSKSIWLSWFTVCWILRRILHQNESQLSTPVFWTSCFQERYFLALNQGNTQAHTSIPLTSVALSFFVPVHVHRKQRADCRSYVNQWPKGENLLLRCSVKSSCIRDHSAAMCQQLEQGGFSAKVSCYC